MDMLLLFLVAPARRQIAAGAVAAADEATTARTATLS